MPSLKIVYSYSSQCRCVKIEAPQVQATLGHLEPPVAQRQGDAQHGLGHQRGQVCHQATMPPQHREQSIAVVNNSHNPNFRGWDWKYESPLWSNNSCLLPPCLGNTKLLWTGKVSSNFHLITAQNDLEKAEIFDPVYKSLKVNYSEENDGSWSRQPVQCTMGSRDFKLSQSRNMCHLFWSYPKTHGIFAFYRKNLRVFVGSCI